DVPESVNRQVHKQLQEEYGVKADLPSVETVTKPGAASGKNQKTSQPNQEKAKTHEKPEKAEKETEEEKGGEARKFAEFEGKPSGSVIVRGNPDELVAYVEGFAGKVMKRKDGILLSKAKARYREMIPVTRETLQSGAIVDLFEDGGAMLTADGYISGIARDRVDLEHIYASEFGAGKFKEVFGKTAPAEGVKAYKEEQETIANRKAETKRRKQENEEAEQKAEQKAEQQSKEDHERRVEAAIQQEKEKTERWNASIAAGKVNNTRYQIFLDSIEDPSEITNNVPYMGWISNHVRKFEEKHGRQPMTPGAIDKWHDKFNDYLRGWLEGNLSERVKNEAEKSQESTGAIENNPDPTAKNLDGGPYTMDYHNAIMKAANNGSLGLDDFHKALDTFLESQEEIQARLNKYTKPVLSGMSARYLRGDEKKAEIVKYVLERMRDFYTLDKEVPNFTFMFGRGTMEEAQAKHDQKILDIAKSVTEQDLSEWAAAVAERTQERKEVKAEREKALTDPQTLDDYRAYMNHQIRDKGLDFEEAFRTLSPEKRAKFDAEAAEKTREQRTTSKDAYKSQVAANAVQTGAEIIATKHTRDDYDLFVVKPADRVERDVYRTWLATAKRMGGWYSKFARNGAIPGFQFKEKENAEAFHAYITEGDTDAAQEKVKERRDAFTDDRSQTAVERLREMADVLEERATEKLNAPRKTNTNRRASMAASAEADANSDIATAKTMRNIAGRIDSGDAKFLDRVRQKIQVQNLKGYIHLGNQAFLRDKYQSYQEQETHKYDAPTIEAADYADYPTYTAYRSDLARLGRQAQETDGLKKIGDRLMKVADDVTDAYLEFVSDNLHKVSTFGRKDGGLATFSRKGDAENAIRRSGFRGQGIVYSVKRGENIIILSPSEAQKRGVWEGDNDKKITLSPDFAELLVGKARRINKIDVPWHFDGVYDKRRRLSAMGIETSAEFRAALREFIEAQVAEKGPDKIKEMERAMVGRANDGLDFFPTPVETVDKMVSVADIQEGMSVLEPSAGMGHIAEQIKEAGVEPDVIEFSSSRRELLEAKGFNVVANDFIKHEGRYDRIIMNPPFSKRRDAEHVQHAYGLLKPGGRLVAIMGEGVFFGGDKKATQFRDWLDDVGGTEEKLAEGTFQDANLPVNTGVNSRMVVIEKPVESAKFSRKDKPFYSELTRQVEAIKQEKGNKLQWLNMVRKLTQKGVKQEEITWSGVEGWLQEQGKSVTKADLVTYLQSQEVVVEE
ncbi:MAG: methyltransferase, partial [Gammaproteobacteria bacterium]|nr:methyltransferase [Gammaproteobacteria bacterium]